MYIINKILTQIEIRFIYYAIIIFIVLIWFPVYVQAIHNNGYGGRPMHLPFLYMALIPSFITLLIKYSISKNINGIYGIVACVIASIAPLICNHFNGIYFGK